MKIFIKCKSGQIGTETQILLSRDILNSGNEIVVNVLDADVVWHQVSNDKEIGEVPNYKIYEKYDGDFVFFINRGGKISVVQMVEAKNSTDFYYKINCKRREVPVSYTKEQIEKLEKQIIDYLLGKGDKVEVLDPFPLKSILSLATFNANKRRTVKTKEYNKEVKRLGLTEQEVDLLIAEYEDTQKFGESELLRMIRSCEEIYTDFLPFGEVMNNVILNCSDSIIQNLFKMMNHRLAIFNILNSKNAKSSENEHLMDYYNEEYSEEGKKLTATVRDALINNKNAFITGSKESQKQMGIYSLFIPDNSLKDGEIMIPRPKHVGVQSQVTTINGNKVTILHSRKTVVIEGPDAFSEELINRFNTGRFRNYVVYQDSIILDKIREYPLIGDYVLGTRHPITTLICRLKVVGYTDDGSIRCNVRTALVLKGDADGDSWSVSWSRWSDDLIYATAPDIDEAAKAANIILDHSEFENRFDINHFVSLTPESAETQLEKSSESGLEQAEAKIKTKELTGLFGSVARDIIQTLIINNIPITVEMIECIASIAQTTVQLKNILADLKDNKISDNVKRDFYNIYLMKNRNLDKTANMLAQLLDVSNEKAVEMLVEWFELDVVPEVKEVEKHEEKSFVNYFNDLINM